MSSSRTEASRTSFFTHKNFCSHCLVPAGLLLLYCLSAGTGVLYASSGFMEPDSCWLVKLGQIILHNRAIPQTDPFSFTLPMLAQQGAPQAFIAYQWLSEIVFAVTFKLANLQGLLILCSVLTSLATLCILFRICVKTGASLVFCFTTVALACGSVALRLMVRPEIFTLFFTSLWLAEIQTIRKRPTAEKNKVDDVSVDKRSVVVLTSLMIAWCNFHSGFVIGIITLIIYAFCYVCRDLSAVTNSRDSNDSNDPNDPSGSPGGSRLSGATRTLLVATATCTLATMINPYGISLWRYLPHLFFSPFNPFLDELLPVSASQLLQPLYYPFFILSVLSVLVVAAILRKQTGPNLDGTALKRLASNGQLTSIFIILAALVAAITCRRLISPLSLLIAVELSMLAVFLWPVSSKRFSIMQLELPVMLLSIISVLIAGDRLVPLTMPQATESFQPPFRAVDYLWDHWHSGNVFNRLQIGSLLEMYGPPKLKIFADTRIDVYSDKILKDYVDILFAHPNYQFLLEKYQIEWVILTRKDPLGAALMNVPAWHKEYEDQESIIFRKAERQ